MEAKDFGKLVAYVNEQGQLKGQVAFDTDNTIVRYNGVEICPLALQRLVEQKRLYLKSFIVQGLEHLNKYDKSEVRNRLSMLEEACDLLTQLHEHQKNVDKTDEV